MAAVRSSHYWEAEGWVLYISLSSEFLDPILVCVCVGEGVASSHTTKQFSDTIRVSENNLAQFWHYLTVGSITFYRLRLQSYKTVPWLPTHIYTSDTTPKPRLLLVLLDLLAINQYIHMTSSWGQLSRSWRYVFLTGLLVITKEYNLETKRFIGQSV